MTEATTRPTTIELRTMERIAYPGNAVNKQNLKKTHINLNNILN